MSLDVYLTAIRPTVVFDCNITHNLGAMAAEAGIYKHLWRPDELGITTAGELVEPLAAGLTLLQSDPERFTAFDAPNGWGVHENLVGFVERYLTACRENPDAKIEVSR